MRDVRAAALLLLTVSAPAAAQFTGPGEPLAPAIASVAVENAHIRTPAGWATHMAIANGVIIAIGDEAAIRPHIGPETKHIAGAGRTIVPGLHDMHVHPMGAGQNAMACAIPQGAPPAKVLAVVKECAARKAPGQWLTGNGYDPSSFGKALPHKSMLDKIAPDRPVLLFDISGHSTWANSNALKLAGIDRNTPNPPGGIIERDARGEPTGILRERASAMAWTKIPAPTREENRRALDWALSQLASLGVTSIDDAGLGQKGALAYADLADAGRLKLRVRGCIMATDPDAIAVRNLYQRDRFRPDCVKIFLDGVPTDAHTAAMVEPYYSPAGHGPHADDGREKGLLMIPQPEINAMVAKYDAMGLTVKFHAAGDAAVRAGLNAIANARQVNGFTGQMHNVGHSSFVQMDDIARAKSIAATFEFSPYIWSPSPITDNIRHAIDEKRMQRWIPIKDALDAGVQAVPGSDWPVTPSANPWLAMETMVTRQAPGGKGPMLGGDERITLDQAFAMFTMASARNQNEAMRNGSLETGKQADFLILDRDIFSVPVTTVHDTRVLATFIGGEQVYDAAQPAPAQP